MLRPYTAECQFDLEFKSTNISIGIATNYHPIQVRNHGKFRRFEKDGNKFNKLRKLPLITYNSVGI